MIMNLTAIHMDVELFLSYAISCGYIPMNGIGRSYDRSIFNFLRNPHTLLS